MKKGNKILLGSLLVICFIDLIIAYQVIGLDRRYLYAENGFLENMQAGLLILSCVVFGTYLFFSGKYHKIFSMAFAFLCLAFFLRELDIEKMNLPTFFILAGSGLGRNILMVVLGGILLIYFIYHFKEIKDNLPAFFFEKSSKIIFVGLLLLVLGGVFDKKSIIVEYGKFYEELFEFTGYYFIFVGSVLGYPCLQKLGTDSDLPLI